MNQYFSEMTEAIKENRGLVLQYVGDTVNSASRISGLTREFSCDVILSQTTHDLLTGSFEMERLPPVKVKGKKEGLSVYKLAG